MPGLVVILQLYSLQLLYVRGLLAFRSLRDIELHFLAFLQRLETITLDDAVMHEYILAILRRDEAIALGVIKPLHFPFCHSLLPPPAKINSK